MIKTKTPKKKELMKIKMIIYNFTNKFIYFYLQFIYKLKANIN